MLLTNNRTMYVNVLSQKNIIIIVDNVKQPLKAAVKNS